MMHTLGHSFKRINSGNERNISIGTNLFHKAYNTYVVFWICIQNNCLKQLLPVVLQWELSEELSKEYELKEVLFHYG